MCAIGYLYIIYIRLYIIYYRIYINITYLYTYTYDIYIYNFIVKVYIITHIRIRIGVFMNRTTGQRVENNLEMSGEADTKEEYNRMVEAGAEQRFKRARTMDMESQDYIRTAPQEAKPGVQVEGAICFKDLGASSSSGFGLESAANKDLGRDVLKRTLEDKNMAESLGAIADAKAEADKKKEKKQTMATELFNLESLESQKAQQVQGMVGTLRRMVAAETAGVEAIKTEYGTVGLQHMFICLHMPSMS